MVTAHGSELKFLGFLRLFLGPSLGPWHSLEKEMVYVAWGGGLA